MITFEPGTVEIRLPFKTFKITTYKTVGFRFNILSWSILCQLFEPEIDFHQIEEVQKTSPNEMFEKMIIAGALSYKFKYGKNPDISYKDLNYWLYKMPAQKSERFKLDIQMTILSSKAMGKTMSEIITENKEEKKN